MPLVNFTKFVDKVESGEKTCTIRALRKIPFAEGDDLHLYTGARTKAVRRLLPAPVECREAWNVKMWWLAPGILSMSLEVDGAYLVLGGSFPTFRRIAALDGFDRVEHMVDFFLPRGRHTFEGQLIRWKHPDRLFVPTLEFLR